MISHWEAIKLQFFGRYTTFTYFPIIQIPKYMQQFFFAQFFHLFFHFASSSWPPSFSLNSQFVRKMIEQPSDSKSCISFIHTQTKLPPIKLFHCTPIYKQFMRIVFCWHPVIDQINHALVHILCNYLCSNTFRHQ